MLHAAMTLLMIGSAVTAAACCLGAGRVAPRTVPWQARQSAVAMALGMLALCAGDGDARVLLLVVAAGIASAMLGVVGTRGRAHADACFHRALGCVVMALCALALLGTRAGSAAGGGTSVSSGHGGHGAVVPISLLSGAGVVLLLALMLAARVRHHAQSGRVDARGTVGALSRRTVGDTADHGAAGGMPVAAEATGRGVRDGRTLLEVEGIAMVISLIVMAAMVLAG